MTTEQEAENKKSQIWVEMEERYRIPIDQETRQYIENTFFRDAHDPEVDSEDFEDMLPDYCGLLAVWSRNHLNNALYNSDAEHIGEANKKRYKKSFEKRLKKVSFVADLNLTFDDLKAQNLKPSNRIDWQLMCDKWNKANPRLKCKMTPKVFKVEYHKYRQEESVKREYFLRKAKHLYAVLRPFADRIDAFEEVLRKAMNNLQESMKEVAKSLRDFHLTGNEVEIAQQRMDDLYKAEMRMKKC